MGYLSQKNLHQNTSIQASVTPFSSIPRAARMDFVTDENWQTKIRKYDREGPGIFGAALDLPASTAMLLKLTVETRTGGQWVKVNDDPTPQVVLDLWQGDCIDQRTMFSRLIRMQDGVGEGYMVVRGEDTSSMHWDIVSKTCVRDLRNGEVEIKTKPDGTQRNGYAYVVPESSVFHFHNPDPEWPDCPWSPMRRGLEHIELYRAIMRNIGRNVNSQLAMNGIMWAKAVGQETNWINNFQNWGNKAYTQDGSVESIIPFQMSTAEKPEWIDVGRGDHKEQIAASEAALKAFASSTDLPTQMLLEGPGQGNHWNSFLENDFYADNTMAPRWQRAASVITETHLKPMLEQMGYDSSKYRVWCDDQRLRSKTDNTDLIFKACEKGIATREAVAEVIGLRSDQIVELPEGLTDYDAFTGATKPLVDALTPEEDTSARIAPGLLSTQPIRAELEMPKYWDELVPS